MAEGGPSPRIEEYREFPKEDDLLPFCELSLKLSWLGRALGCGHRPHMVSSIPDFRMIVFMADTGQKPMTWRMKPVTL